MAKPELGTKRLCPNCGTKYYDLNNNPILCPRCGAPFDPHVTLKAKAAIAVEEEEDQVEEDSDLSPEFVPLEEAEPADGEDVPEIEDADIEDDAVDDTFLEAEDEDEGDVSDIIGDVNDEEER